MNDRFLLKNIAERTQYILTNKLPAELTFHYLEHTETVVEGVRVIANGEGLDENEMIILEIAALLHDVGYQASLQNNEERSIEIATEIMQELEAPKKEP